MDELLAQVLEQFIYIGTVMILIACGMGVPFPEEAVFLAAGFIGKKLDCNLPLLCGCGVLGIMLGDSIPFYAGRWYGMSLLKKRWVSKLMTPKRIEWVQGFYNAHGAKAVFAARFMAGVRMPAFFMAGCMGVKYRVFFFYDLMGALISCPTSIWLAYTYGEKAHEIIKQSHTYLFIALGVLVLYIVYHIWSHRPKKDELETPPEGAAATRNEPPAVVAAAPVQEAEVQK